MIKKSRSSALQNKEPEYQGLLAEPLAPPDPLLGKEEEDKWLRFRKERMQLLIKHSNLDPEDPFVWARLADKLASRHVPGFMPPPKKRGRPRERDDDFILMIMVELRKRRDGMSASRACDDIAKTKAISGKAETLRTRYKRLKANMKPVIEFLDRVAQRIGEAKFIHVLEQTIEELLHPL